MPKLIQLAPGYEQNRGFTHKVVLNWDDINSLTSGTAYSVLPQKNATTGAWEIIAAASASTVAAGTIVKQSVVRVTTAFNSTLGTITLVMVLGDDGDTARYAASTTLKTAGYFATTLKMPFLYTAANTIDFIVTAGVEAITTLTAGEVEIYLEIVDPSGLQLPTVLSNA